MQVGSEFLHLCQEQVNLLTRGFGASLAIVALVERPMRNINAREVTFLPVITYPEAFTSVDPDTLKLWLVDIWLAEANQGSSVRYEEAAPMGRPRHQETETNDLSLLHGSESSSSYPPESIDSPTVIPVADGALGPRAPLMTSNQNQIVMPLIYQELMVGLLVTARVDRGWNQLERYDIERVGHTLAAACVLEQRSQWLEQRLHQQSTAYAHIQEHQQDILDDVLHQFRNPLTALRTFGKLLIKRLQPTDRNRTVAESIVRESDRLQDLLQQLSAAAAIPSIALPGTQENAPTDATHTTVLIPSTSDTSLSPTASETDAVASEAESVDENHRGIHQPSSRAQISTSGQETADTVKALTGQAIHLQSCDPMDILGPLLLSAQAIAQDRSLDLCVTCPDHRAPIWADAKALREVCNNLIDNALKYTPAKGKVNIIVGIEPDQALGEQANDTLFVDGELMQGIAIADTGPGIPIADQAHLFERHFRGVQGQGDIPGTGLGLAIAQLLTQQMEGIIQVFSPVETCPLTSIKDDLEQARQSKPASVVGAGTLFIVWLRCSLSPK